MKTNTVCCRQLAAAKRLPIGANMFNYDYAKPEPFLATPAYANVPNVSLRNTTSKESRSSFHPLLFSYLFLNHSAS